MLKHASYYFVSVKVDWLNKFIEIMWPYLDKVYLLQSTYILFLSIDRPLLFNPFFLLFFGFQAICKTAKTIAKPIIAEQIPKYKIDSVDFEALTLGSLPPTFQGSVPSSFPSRWCTNTNKPVVQ